MLGAVAGDIIGLVYECPNHPGYSYIYIYAL